MIHFASAALAFRQRLQRLFGIKEWQSALLWAIFSGALGAFATELFRLALSKIDFLVLGRGSGLVEIAQGLPWWSRIAVPTVGGLLAGALLMLAERSARKRKVVSDYMEAIVLGDGRIPSLHTLERSASSMISIASGGSIGREGSMVQLAALCASILGRAAHFPVARLRLLVACGAAAGLTAAYSAPIAGAFFIAEIVLGSIAMESIGPILVASVVANITMRNFPGYQPPYQLPAFPVISGLEMLLFAPLGMLVGAAAVLFLRGLRATRRVFASLPIALPWRLGLGGLLVGLISVRLPQVWGNGYSVVNSVLHVSWAWQLLGVLLLAKVVATLATVGSGAVGGVFTPALFFGCMIGALFGHTAQAFWPQATAAPFAYAIVGMGAFLAGATQAPIMAILMIFEMTLNYQVMLPLMVASVISYFVVRSADAGSMYDVTIRRQKQQTEHLRLRSLQVRELVEPTETVVTPDASVEEMSKLFLQHPVKYLYVVEGTHRYLGVVPLKSFGLTGNRSDLECLSAKDLIVQEIEPMWASMSLSEALERFMRHRGERLPVVESAEQPQLLGVVTKSRLLATYERLSA